jgi:hypothetical protein
MGSVVGDEAPGSPSCRAEDEKGGCAIGSACGTESV